MPYLDSVEELLEAKEGEHVQSSLPRRQGGIFLIVLISFFALTSGTASPSRRHSSSCTAG